MCIICGWSVTPSLEGSLRTLLAQPLMLHKHRAVLPLLSDVGLGVELFQFVMERFAIGGDRKWKVVGKISFATKCGPLPSFGYQFWLEMFLEIWGGTW